MARGSINGFLGLVLLIVPMLILSSSEASAFTFNVGGEDGWVVKPSEDYGHWAQRNRFQVNDTLYFKYKRGTDSVLVVTKEDYDLCNTTKPLHRFKGGGSTIQLHESGPIYFISGNVENCKQGQKLIVVVMAVRHNHVQSPSPSSTPPQPSAAPSSPPSKPPSTPPSRAPSPSVAPSTPPSKAPSPSVAPSTPPSKAPSTPPSTTPSVAPATPSSVAPATPPTGFDAPAPAPSGNSASKRSFGVVLGSSVVVALFFSSFA